MDAIHCFFNGALRTDAQQPNTKIQILGGYRLGENARVALSRHTPTECASLSGSNASAARGGLSITLSRSTERDGFSLGDLQSSLAAHHFPTIRSKIARILGSCTRSYQSGGGKGITLPQSSYSTSGAGSGASLAPFCKRYSTNA